MACLLTFITMPDTLVFVGLEVLLTKFYVISFLAMLIARKRIADVTPMPTTSSGPVTNNSNSRKSQSRVVRLDTVASPVENGIGSVKVCRSDYLNSRFIDFHGRPRSLLQSYEHRPLQTESGGIQMERAKFRLGLNRSCKQRKDSSPFPSCSSTLVVYGICRLV